MMISSKIIHGLSMVRSGVYFLEALPIAVYQRLARPDIPPPNPDQIKSLWGHINHLHERDSRHFADGTFSLQMMDIENPIRHLRGFSDVLADGVKVAWRMWRKNAHDFQPKSVRDHADEAPEYYSRNFHFQTDGYFSEPSARRYDHQVEILFNGTAGAMRRMIIPPLKAHLPKNSRLLEIGCGAGSATRYLAAAFTDARITALDMSGPYLKVAQDNLRSRSKIDFIQGDGTQLDFKDATFDAVTSVYLFHELPEDERGMLIREAWRTLKPGGIMVFADSLQWDDEPDLNWALERFPKIYHEPFYKNYLNKKLEDLIQTVTGLTPHVERGLFTKVLSVIKPEK